MVPSTRLYCSQHGAPSDPTLWEAFGGLSWEGDTLVDKTPGPFD
jgi:hypothetical protein